MVAGLRSAADNVQRFRNLLVDLSGLLELGVPFFNSVCVACGQMPGSALEYVLQCQSAVRRLWAVVVPPAGRFAAESLAWLADCLALVAAAGVAMSASDVTSLLVETVSQVRKL